MARYWDGDGAWLATDSDGYVAVFTTAGVAPIPRIVLEAYLDWSAEDRVSQLAELGAYDLLVRYPRPDDFIGFAARGFYAYDWQDVHRVSGKTRAYELIARPHVPIRANELPADLAAVVALMRFDQISFASNANVAIEKVTECVSS